jgi:dihydrodipicolinate synthase/N-acetylneuraminate lyase
MKELLSSLAHARRDHLSLLAAMADDAAPAAAEPPSAKAAPVIGGLFAAMITPYDDSGHLNVAVAEAFVRFYVEKGVDGVFVISNVGEFALLPIEERRELIRLCRRAGGPNLKVCPGVTAFQLEESLAMAAFAKAEGADAVILSAPIYYPYSAQYVESFIFAFLDKAPLPVLFYNSPKFANPVPVDTLVRIMSHPNIISMKESSADVMFLLKYLARAERAGIKKPVMLGFEELLLTGLAHGAAGCITCSAGVVPELLRGIIDSFRAGDFARAASLQKSVARITEAVGAYGFPHGFKAAMAARGFSFRIAQAQLPDQEERFQGAIQPLKALIDAELEAHGLK